MDFYVEVKDVNPYMPHAHLCKLACLTLFVLLMRILIGMHLEFRFSVFHSSFLRTHYTLLAWIPWHVHSCVFCHKDQRHLSALGCGHSLSSPPHASIGIQELRECPPLTLYWILDIEIKSLFIVWKYHLSLSCSSPSE